jgi:hypothetical protein
MTDTRQSGTIPHSQHAKLYLSAFDGSPDGLTEAEAALRMAEHGPNPATRSTRTPCTRC